MSNEREIWFHRRRSLVAINLPVHWKGWVVVAVFMAVVLAIATYFFYVDANVPTGERWAAYAIGWIAFAIAFLIEIIVVVRHRD